MFVKLKHAYHVERKLPQKGNCVGIYDQILLTLALDMYREL